MSKANKSKKNSSGTGKKSNQSKKPAERTVSNRGGGMALEKEADEIELDEEKGKQEFNRENP